MSTYDAAPEQNTVQDSETLLTPMAKTGSTARELLARKLTDIVVLPAGRISSNERAVAADVLLQVLDKVEEELRIEVATRVARVPECPPALLRALLLDEPEVSGKIIQGAESIPEALLIEVARDAETAHRMLIARRLDLSTAVADAVLQYDEIEVCKLVLKRDECVLSPNAINKLVALSATKNDIPTLLLRRRELEPAHGFMMFWWVDSERRRRILTRFALDRAVIQDAINDLYPRVFRSNDDPDPFVKDILILMERRHRPRGVNNEPVGMDVVLRTLGAAVKFESPEIIEAVGMIGGVSRELAARILRDPSGEPFAVLSKSLGVPRDEFFALFDGAEGSQADPGRGDYLLGVFDSMARDFARAVLRYWDWDGNPRIAHITRMIGLIEDEDF